MDSVVGLLINGQEYRGWQSARIMRSVDTVSGQFELAITDKWAQAGVSEWPIRTEDECEIRIDGETIMSGWIGEVATATSPEEVEMTITGKDRAAALVENSIDIGAFTLRKIRMDVAVRRLAAQFGISVTVQKGLVLPTFPKISISPGEAPWEVIRKMANAAGVLVISDAKGGIVITRSGATRAEPIIGGSAARGTSMETVDLRRSAEDRFYRYIVYSTPPGDDNAHGEALHVRAEAIDKGVRRTDRTKVLVSNDGLTRAEAKQWADWEARVRAARSESFTTSVDGWRQRSGDLWLPNQLVPVKSTRADVRGLRIISQAVYTLSDDGQGVALTLSRPDAYTPSPSAIVEDLSK